MEIGDSMLGMLTTYTYLIYKCNIAMLKETLGNLDAITPDSLQL